MEEKNNPKGESDNRKNKKGKKPSADSRKGKRLLLILLLVILAMTIAGTIIIFPMTSAKAPTSAMVKIPKDARNNQIADTLTKYFGQDYSDRVMRYVNFRGLEFASRHGAYRIKAGYTPLQAVTKIFRRGQSPVRITINGFRSLPLLTERIGNKMEFSNSDLEALLQDTTFLSKYGLTPDNALALFFEDTYEVYWTDSPEKVMKKIGDNYLSFWSPARVKRAHEMGLSRSDLMILGSIADEETNKAQEKGRIGRLYINRLITGMKLQSDPTVRFALNDYTIRRVKGEHLHVDSPYNTYKYAGLPPGPIRTTSRETVEAILTSKLTNDIYMCAREDFSGYHNFAATYDEHLRNAAKYQKALDARGIK